MRITSLTYCLKDVRRRTKERERMEREWSVEELIAVSVLGVGLGVVGGGGLGSSLQQMLGMVWLPLFSWGQQKLP